MPGTDPRCLPRLSVSPYAAADRSAPARALVGRRQFIGGATALAASALAGCTVERAAGTPPAPPTAPPPALRLTPLRATTDRITVITVCTRPFRPQGPRLEVEPVLGKTVVHNYGHGGSGWSLSWGSSAIAVEKAMASGEREVAVIGCGALGLTSALLLQRAGARVTIYAKDLPPNVRSSLATGVFTPDSRICFEQYATPAFRAQWEIMTRRSFSTYQTFLGLAGSPVEFVDNYFVSDTAELPGRAVPEDDARPRFAELQRDVTPDLLVRSQLFAPGSHSLGAHYLRRNSELMFNLAAYQHLLMADYLANGGQIRIEEFHTPADLRRIREKTLINATGYGARALFDDRSIIPVRGQLARMIPQPDVDYGLIYKDVAFVPRRDGMVFQVIGASDYYGFDNDSTTADRAEAERAVNTIAGLFSA